MENPKIYPITKTRMERKSDLVTTSWEGITPHFEDISFHFPLCLWERKWNLPKEKQTTQKKGRKNKRNHQTPYTAKTERTDKSAMLAYCILTASICICQNTWTVAESDWMQSLFGWKFSSRSLAKVNSAMQGGTNRATGRTNIGRFTRAHHLH